MRHLLPLALLAAGALTTSAADAAVLPGVAVDGPSVDVKSLGNVDMATDGTGGIAYTRTQAGKDHVFVVRITGGRFGAPERVDPGIDEVASEPSVAAGTGGRLIVTWLSDDGKGVGGAAVRSAIAGASGAPFVAKTVTLNRIFSSNSVEASPSGLAYAVNSGGENVFAFRFDGTAWIELPLLDNDPAKVAGGSMPQDQPRVAVTGDGNAVVAWPEGEAGSQVVYARRLTAQTLGPAKAAPVPTLDGFASSTQALMVDVDVDGSGAAWVVFRQDFAYGAPVNDRGRVLARKLTGDFGPAQAIDGLPSPPPSEAAEFPRVDVNAAGAGLAATSRQIVRQAWASSLTGANWSAGFRVDAASATADVTKAVSALGDNGAGLIAWRQDPGGGNPAVALARTRVGGVLGGEVPLSLPGGGAVDGAGPFDAAADANGNAVVAFAQGAGATRRIVAAIVDGPPTPSATPTAPATTPTPTATAPTAQDRDKPFVTGSNFSDPVFSIGTGAPALVKAARPKVGTTIRFTVSEASRVRFAFDRPAAGRRVGGRCVKQTKGNRRRPGCTLFRSDGLFELNVPAGAARVQFSGRLTATKKLSLGKHRLTLTATDGAGNVSDPQSQNCKIVKRR